MWAIVPVIATSLPPVLRAAETRPELSGPVVTVDFDLFRIHYTRSGDDAPLLTDDDDNGHPDLIDAVRTGVEIGRDGYLAEGWRPLRQDRGTGGTVALDIYVRDLPIFGYAHPIEADDGTWSCFMEIDSGTGVGGRVAESVAAHELHHCVEFRYTVDMASWLYEAAATYEQYSHITDPVLDAALGVLYTNRLAHPERKLASLEDRDEYAAFLWMKFWAELGEEDRPERLPELWEILAQGETWRDTLDLAARAQFGVPLDTLYVEHNVWNTFACSADDGLHYSDGPLPCILDYTAPVEPWDGRSIEVVHEDGPFTATWLDLEVDSPGDWELDCAGTDGMALALVQVADGVRGNDVSGGIDVPTLQLDLEEGDIARAIVAGTSDEPLDATCRLREHRGSGSCSHTSGAAGAAMLLALLAMGRRSR